MKNKIYLCCDLKSFYASVECVERGLDPMTTNLVVADLSRTEKTICLAVTPSLKAYGISGRARLFEVVQKVKEVNAQRLYRAPGRKFFDSSYDDTLLKQMPELSLDYIVATPRMALYMRHSARIYEIYLKYVAPDDLYSYSIDEVFMDITPYLKTYGISAHELAKRIIQDVYQTTGITATAGLGTNLFLAKVAMDIVSKHVQADEDGVRIAELDEMSYRRLLWDHHPLTDFWRVGPGYAKKLEAIGIRTMGDIARCSVRAEDVLYNLFGVNAELLIDHSWGWEPCTIADIKAYKPQSHSMGGGQVLQYPYTFDKAQLVVREMAERLALDLLAGKMVTDQIVLTVGYDRESLAGGRYQGPVKADRYGREVPKHAHGSINLGRWTSSYKLIVSAAMELYERIVNPELLIRRLYLVANHATEEASAVQDSFEQLDLFTDMEAKRKEEEALAKERSIQQAMLDIQKKYGKNAILKAASLEEGATARERNRQIGGHKA
ncbi:MAG: DNA methylase [Oscillospiraceae bacterium]|nr:DNA methylase [Oscillospiraceae bacterium]